jgi:phosphoglycolate phosphatase
MQDMEETLHALARHRKLCIVTSKPESQAVQIIQARNLEKYFEFVIGSDPLYHSTKTDLLKKALSSFLGLNLLDSWMIGDRHHDIDAARNVGMNSLGVTWGYGNHTELKTAQADLIIGNPGQLLEMFL